jgi:hypothetical protein
MPNIMTARAAKKQVTAPRVAVIIKHLTDARKFVVMVMTRKIISKAFVINAKVAIVCTA